MIRIVFSDLDGTLIRYRQPEITQEIFDAVRELTAAGVVFCPASGRTHESLRQMFAPVADDVYFICENGAAVFYRAAVPIASKPFIYDPLPSPAVAASSGVTVPFST